MKAGDISASTALAVVVGVSGASSAAFVLCFGIVLALYALAMLPCSFNTAAEVSEVVRGGGCYGEASLACDKQHLRRLS